MKDLAATYPDATAAEQAPQSGVFPVRGEDVRAHMHLVYPIVSRLLRRLPANVLRDDLVAAGVFGLIDSLRKNGGAGGASFEGYARIRIRGAIVDELRAQDWLPRRARWAATASAGQPGVEGPAVPCALVSLDDLGEAERAAHVDVLGVPGPDAEVEIASTLRALARAVEKLPERERRIVGLHYFQGVKFKDIGAVLGVSEPRVSQLHARAIDLLRRRMTRAA